MLSSSMQSIDDIPVAESWPLLLLEEDQALLRPAVCGRIEAVQGRSAVAEPQRGDASVLLYSKGD